MSTWVCVVFHLDGQSKITEPFDMGEKPTLLAEIINQLGKQGGFVTEVIPIKDETPKPRRRGLPRYTRANGRPLAYLPRWFPFDFVGRGR